MLTLDDLILKSGLQIKVAKSAGFCPGVKNAVKRAEKLIQENNHNLYMYGEIVHNDLVVQDLLEGGFELIHGPHEINDNGVCLIRAHGITSEEEALLKSQDVIIDDQTCIWVKKIHELVRQAKDRGDTLILCGNPDHPEMRGILSRAGDNTIVIESLSEAEMIVDEGKNYLLAAQTTFPVETFQKICESLERTLIKLKIFDTICFTTTNRQTEAREIAEKSDLVLVLGSAHSSNTNKLLDICKANCSKTYLIQRPDQVIDLLKGWDLRQMRIGITAGASTPERMIREVIYVMTENQNFSPVEENTVAAESQEVPEELTSESTEPTAGIDTEEQAQAEETVVAEEASKEETPVEETDTEDDSKEEGEFSFSDYIDGIPQLKRGAVVTGTIIRYDDEFVYVDVRDKSEGKVPRHEFVDDPELDLDEAVANHEEVDVYVRHIKNTDMGKEIMLSKARVDFEKHKEVIRKAYEEQTPVTVKVTNVVKDGIIASYGSVDLYIHRTQIELRPVNDLEKYRGQTMEVLITQFDPNRRRLRVSGSSRSLLQAERDEKAKELWDNIEVGKEYEGKVRNLTNFGAFVDIGGVDGLVHISELSWKRIKHPSEVVQVGDILKVFVIDYDQSKDRISLGYRRPENDPYHNIEERFPQGSIVRGIVVRMFPFGAFVEIAPGVDALCHISQISNYHLNHPEDVLQVGMEIDARVLSVSDKERKISISIKEVEPIDPANPEEFIQHQPRERRSDRGEEGDDRRPRRERRPRQDRREREATTYVDSSAGSSMASLANVTVASEAGAELLESLREQEEAAEADARAKEEARKAEELAARKAEQEAKAQAEAEASEETAEAVEEATEEVEE